MHLAALSGSEGAVHTLVEAATGQKALLGVANNGSQSPLHSAAEGGSAEAVQLLIEQMPDQAVALAAKDQ